MQGSSSTQNPDVAAILAELEALRNKVADLEQERGASGGEERAGKFKIENPVPVLEGQGYHSYKQEVEQWLEVERDPNKKNSIPEKLLVHALHKKISLTNVKYKHLRRTINPLSEEFKSGDGVNKFLGEVLKASGEEREVRVTAFTDLCRIRKPGESVESFHKTFLTNYSLYTALLPENNAFPEVMAVDLLMRGLSIQSWETDSLMRDEGSKGFDHLNAYVASRYPRYHKLEADERRAMSGTQSRQERFRSPPQGAKSAQSIFAAFIRRAGV
jgi:hypothetical protein